MNVWSRRGWRRLALAGAVALPALAAVSAGLVQVTRCVAVPGGVGRLGIHLALLQPAPDCPTGGTALGGDQGQVLAVVLMLTLPMVLVHAFAISGGWGALRALRRSAARLAQLTPWRVLPRETAILVPDHQPVSQRSTLRVPGLGMVRVPLLRGPPLAVPA